ncbi:MAG: PfkB family carbohydrate kinase [Planctomycetota bacterium]
MPKIICLGELLIDFPAAEADVSLAEAETFTKAPGGAPANVAVGAVRLGESTGFVGAVGDDPFGDFLAGVLQDADVEISHLARIPDVRTTLAFIAARSDGRKDITFYRNPGADMFLAPEHVDEQYLRSADALHYGSISRIDDRPRAATDRARELAREAGLLVSYDPNWRPALWPDPEAARQRILEGFENAVVAKVSEEEWEFVTHTRSLPEGARVLFDRGVELVVRSEGANGSSFATPRTAGRVWPFPVECVEPTGAGDGQMACLIVELLKAWRDGVRPGDLADAELERIVRRSNAIGALACRQLGAIPALPTAEQVDQFLDMQE